MTPVMYIDRDGTFPVLIVLGSILLGGLISGAFAFASGFAGGFLGDVTSQQISYGNVDWTQSFIAGGISGTMNSL